MDIVPADWLTQLHPDRCLSLSEAPLPGSGVVVALGPHPDDPDAIAVTLRALMQGGWDVFWVILNSGWSGVQDDFVGPDRAAKGQAREAEERAAVRLFGLPEQRLLFLRLEENDAGETAVTADNHWRFTTCLEALNPALVLLPYGQDTNPDHRLTYTWFSIWAGDGVIGLANEDPKSVGFEPNLAITFGEASAAWKADILECHQSQSVRNQRTRGRTFADRILAVNRAGMPAGMYAERFRVVKGS